MKPSSDIRKDIPIPAHFPRGGRPSKSPFDEMDVGGSFLVEDDRLGAVRTSVCRKNKAGQKKFIVGRHSDKSGAQSWRCWRIA